MKNLWNWLNPRCRYVGMTWIHHVLTIYGVLLVALLFSLVGFAAGWYTHKGYVAHGGFVPVPQQKLPPQVQISGSPPPAKVDLTRFLVRIHDQGSSNSCVGQTLSTMTEIERAESGHRVAYSPSYIWSQLNGGLNTGISYPSAFGLLTTQGDASQAAMNGVDPAAYYGSILPSPAQRADAYPQHASSYRTVALTDTYTIESELAAGHPLAFAAAWDSNWENHWNTTAPLPYLSPNLQFWHSTTIIGYSPAGVLLLNSWGSTWGNNGEALVPWGVLQSSGGFLAVSQPSFPTHKAPRPFPVKRWQQHKRVAYSQHGRLVRVAWVWFHDKGVARTAGSPRGPERYIKRLHVHKQYFDHRIAYHWSDRRGTVRFEQYPRRKR